MLSSKIINMKTPTMIVVIIGLIIISLMLSFCIFTFGYWLIALILEGFFSFILPFSWWYALGAWLIALVINVCLLPGLLISRSSN